MPTSFQTITTAASGVMTGWTGTDPARYVEVAVEVDIDPIIWEIWTLNGAGHWDLGGSVASILPESGGNNLPHLQMRWDLDGIWRQTRTGIQSGSGLSSGFATGTRPATQTTISFRMANDADFIGGIFSPRSFDGLNIVLFAVPPVGATTEYGHGVMYLGLSLSATGPVRLRTGRSWAQVVG